MQKWEYTTTAMSVTDSNAMGADGWEMVTVMGGMMFWKRVVEPEPAAAAPAPKSRAAAKDDD